MKLDTTSYYPPSPLDDEPEEEVIMEIEENIEAQKPTSEPSRDDLDNESGDDRYEYPPTIGEVLADRVSTFLSWVLVPLLMPVYGVLFAFNLSILNFTPVSVKTTFALITVAFTVVIPAMLVFLLKRMGVVQDIGLNGQKERLIPYIISIVSMAGTGIFMWYKGAPMWLVMFFAGGAVAGLVNLLINFRWKISAHAAGIAGVVALLIRIMHTSFSMPSSFVWLVVMVALAGLLGSSRVWLGRHTVWQVIAGYAVGFTSVILMTLIG